MKPEDVLDADVGTWDAEVTSFVPGGDPQKTSGRRVSRRVGGWVVTDFTTATGFAGHGTSGWDAARERYVNAWIDSARTFLVVAEGTWDAEKREMTYRATVDVGGRTMAWREITTNVDGDTQVYRLLMDGPDGGTERMRVIYRRIAAS